MTAGCSSLNPDAIVQDISKKALEAKDKKICETLQTEKDKAYCIGLIDDSHLVDQAIAMSDMKICGTIKDSHYKKACEVAATTAERKAAEEKAEKEKLNTLQSGDSLEACNQMNNPDMKEQCRINVILKIAHDQKNTKICDELASESLRSICKSDA